MATATLKRHLHELQRGRPGHRFQERYERQQAKGSRNANGRWLRIALAMGAFAIGVVLVFIPGPAIVFFFLAGGLLATDSRPLARMMDWIELRARAVWRWAEERWKKLPAWAKVALALLGGAAGLASTYLFYRWWTG